MRPKYISFLTVLLFSLNLYAGSVSEFFEGAPYKGAFGVTNWANNWTALEHYGVLTPASSGTNRVDVFDNSINPGETVYWTADNEYHLNGRVFVDDGARLFIEAGTVIKGMPGDSIDASVLVVARGGQIFAEGTADRPIIFTAENDDVANPLDIAYDTKGLWGGVIILGDAPINRAAGEHNIEGIPTTEDRGIYGGSNADDNSGIFRYVSIRHGGISIGDGNEINGLTMGGVGRGTTIEYVEVYANQDDGFEWFGGTVNCRNLIAAFCGDDAFDHDEGLQCKMQFLFAVQHADFGNMCAEHDGAPSKENLAADPKAYPVIYNATFLGSGQNSTNPEQERIFRIRENWGGEYRNSIFGDYNGYGLDIEDKYDTDSRDRLAAGELHFTDNIWFNVNGFTLADSIGRYDYVNTYLNDAATNNVEADPLLRGISRAEDGGLDPRPAENSPAWDNLGEFPDDDFFVEVNYKGAFGASNWAQDWTALEHYGVLTPAVVGGGTDITVNDADLSSGNVFWTANNTYHLNGRIFVDDGAALNIEAGTVIKGMPGDSIDASVLVVARGAKLFAEGSATRPIIFTAENDDVANPLDIAFDTKGLWGGVIMLGKAPINRAAGEHNIEGIPTTEDRGIYGGTDENDCSGFLRHVSIRHGGISIGDGNEINGLTMGGVGDNTTLEYIEVFANQDDGFEWFGGTVSGKNLIAAFCGDDAFDHDEGLQCKMQYIFAIQHADFGNMCAEHDGAPSKENLAAIPKAYPVIYNATFLGSGQNSTNPEQERIFRIRENWGGEYNNSIFGDYNGYGLDIEDKYDTDSRDRLAAGEIHFTHNIWFNVNGYTLADSIGRYDYVNAYLNDATTANVEVDPQLTSISRTEDAGLDPRPAHNGPAYSDVASQPVGIRAAESRNTIPADFVLKQNYPNPFNPITNISFSLPNSAKVTLNVYNILGQKVASLVNQRLNAGSYRYTWNAGSLSSGIYIYQLRAGKTVINKKMSLVK